MSPLFLFLLFSFSVAGCDMKCASSLRSYGIWGPSNYTGYYWNFTYCTIVIPPKEGFCLSTTYPGNYFATSFVNLRIMIGEANTFFTTNSVDQATCHPDGKNLLSFTLLKNTNYSIMREFDLMQYGAPNSYVEMDLMCLDIFSKCVVVFDQIIIFSSSG